MPKNKKGKELGKEMKDLVRGTIYCELENVIDAYKFFKDTPDVDIIDIKENLDLLSNITVNFIYKKMYTGEMQF